VSVEPDFNLQEIET